MAHDKRYVGEPVSEEEVRRALGTPEEVEAARARIEARDVQYHKVFRFNLTIGSPDETRALGLSAIHWEGPHLVFTRGMQETPPRLSLFRELKNKEIQVQLLAKGGAVVMVWRVEYGHLRDRGFLFMNAVENTVAHEAVCLTDAVLHRVKGE